MYCHYFMMEKSMYLECQESRSYGEIVVSALPHWESQSALGQLRVWVWPLRGRSRPSWCGARWARGCWRRGWGVGQSGSQRLWSSWHPGNKTKHHITKDNTHLQNIAEILTKNMVIVTWNYDNIANLNCWIHTCRYTGHGAGGGGGCSAPRIFQIPILGQKIW